MQKDKEQGQGPLKNMLQNPVNAEEVADICTLSIGAVSEKRGGKKKDLFF